MTLDEAFKKYSDDIKLNRPGYMSHDIAWLKQLKAWGNNESRTLGYIIPQFMIDDANATDWEVTKQQEQKE